MANQKIQPETVTIDLTPHYMAKLSCDIFRSAMSYDSGSKLPWYKYFLFCVVIELGLKATLLNDNNTLKQKEKNKQIGHNLTELRKEVSKKLPKNFFDSANEKVIDQVSRIFCSKSLEYLSGELLSIMITGSKQLPPIADLEAVTKKVIGHIEESDCFKGSNTRP